jgi:hypothetical protein
VIAEFCSVGCFHLRIDGAEGDRLPTPRELVALLSLLWTMSGLEAIETIDGPHLVMQDECPYLALSGYYHGDRDVLQTEVARINERVSHLDAAACERSLRNLEQAFQISLKADMTFPGESK